MNENSWWYEEDYWKEKHLREEQSKLFDDGYFIVKRPKNVIHTESSKEANDKLYRDYYDRGIAVWTTKDGKELDIEDMTNNHVINTYNFLQRKTDKTEFTGTWIKIFELEKERRGL